MAAWRRSNRRGYFSGSVPKSLDEREPLELMFHVMRFREIDELGRRLSVDRHVKCALTSRVAMGPPLGPVQRRHWIAGITSPILQGSPEIRKATPGQWSIPRLLTCQFVAGLATVRVRPPARRGS